MKKDLQILKALITEMQSGDCCTECGGAMYEGMCTECGYMEEKLTYTDEYDDNPKLKGRQSKLPDQLQKAIIKKGTNEDSNSRGKETDDAINSSELNMLKNIYKNTDPSKIPARHVERMKELEAMLGITKLPTDYAGNPSIPVEEEHEGADHEVSMANNSIDSILWAANELKKHLQGGERDIPAWIQDHITNAENYIVQAAKNFHEYGAEEAPQEEPAADDMSLASLMGAKNYLKYEKNNLNEISVDENGKLIIKQQYDTVSDYANDAKIGDYIWIGDNIDNFKYASRYQLYKVVGKDDKGNLILRLFKRSTNFEMSPKSPGLENKKLVVVAEVVKKVGSKYNVYSKKGKKLGSHPSKKKAQKQMAAIEISKQGK